MAQNGYFSSHTSLPPPPKISVYSLSPVSRAKLIHNEQPQRIQPPAQRRRMVQTLQLGPLFALAAGPLRHDDQERWQRV